MDLREPKRKRVKFHGKLQQALPIPFDNENETVFGSDAWPLFVGFFNGDSVVVYNPEEMATLYTMGFFGKGSLSRGYPAFEMSKSCLPPVIKERQWKRRKLWIEMIKNTYTQKSHTQIHTTDEIKGDQCNTLDQAEVSAKKNSNPPESSSFINEEDKNDLDNNVIHTARLDQLESSHMDDSKNLDFTLDGKVLVLADSDDEDLEKIIRDPTPHLEDEPIKTVAESLYLTLEEAFFLSYALGCLQVVDMTDKIMPLKVMWTTFCDIKPNFIESYVVYHYFRAKGWVVKAGNKFAGDFLLYKKGPAFYHASYIVLVDRVDDDLMNSNDSLTWTKLHGLNRLAENSGKDILTCQVLFPASFTSEDLTSPKCLSQIQINEVLTKRWKSSEERIEKDKTLK